MGSPSQLFRVCSFILSALLVLSEAGRSPEDLVSSLVESSSTQEHKVQQQSKPLLVATRSERLSGLQKTAIADVDDENRDVAPAAFGDYYYQDKVSTQITRDPQHLLALGHGAAEHVGLDAAISQGQRQAYLLEDGSGRLSVVEHESRSLPDGGRMTWQRTTGPGGVMLTAVAASSSDETSGSLQAALEGLPSSVSSSGSGYLPIRVSHFMPSFGFFSGAVHSALAPINQLLDALNSHQQQMTLMMMPMPLELPAGQHHGHPGMLHRKHGPCRHHFAMMSRAARRQQQQQGEAVPEIGQLIGEEQQQLADFAERFGVLQEDELSRLSQELQLKEVLEENGLALSESGNVIPLDEAKHWEAAVSAPDQPDLEELYLEYVDPVQETADFADSAYENIYDSDEDYYASSMDYDLDAAAMGDYSQLLASFLDSLRRNMSDAGAGLDNMRQWVNVDALLLVLLVGCTVGMCVLFLQSLVQLRPMLMSGSTGVAAVPIKAMAPVPVVVAAAGLKSGSRRESPMEEDLSQPLLLADDSDSESVIEQQQQQQVAPLVQRFYNPLHYQPLPGKM